MGKDDLEELVNPNLCRENLEETLGIVKSSESLQGTEYFDIGIQAVTQTSFLYKF